MTHNELKELVIKKNYHLLFMYIKQYERCESVSWVDAMEAVAIALSDENAKLREELIRIHQTGVINIVETTLVKTLKNES